MADKKTVIFEVDVEVQGNADEQINKILNSTDSAKKKLKELRQAALEATDPVVFQKYTQAAGELQDQIADTNQAIKNFASDTKNLDVAVGAVQGVAAAFATAQGAAALFGGENEDLQKTLVKVQGSLAVLNGLTELQNLLQKESAVGAKLYAAANAILNSSMLAQITTSKALKVALVGTGIGALVVGVGLLIANFEDVKEAVLKFIPGLKIVGDLVTGLVQGFTDFFGITSDATRELDKLEGTTKKVTEANERQIKVLEAQGGKEKEIYDLKVKNINDEIALLNKKAQVNKKLTDEEQKQLLDLENEKKVLAAQEKKRLDDDRKEEAEKQKKANEEAAKKYQEYLQKREEIRLANKTRAISLIQDENAQELALFDLQREEIKKKAKKAGEDLSLVDAETAKLRADLVAKQNEEIANKQLQGTKALVEADGKLTIEELKKIQAQELVLLQQQLANKKITQDQFNAAVQAQQTALNTATTEANKTVLDQQLSDLDMYYQTLELKQGEAGLTPEQLQSKADQEAAIYKSMLDQKLISQAEYDLKLAEGQAAVAQKTKEVSEQTKEKEKKDAEEVAKARNDAANSAIQTLGNLSAVTELFAGKDEKSRKKAFEANKKLQIAQALIQTYQGANAAFTAATANPITTFFPPYPFLAAGAAVAAGLANVARIKAQTYQGGGGGGGSTPSAAGAAGGGGGSAPTPPQVNPFRGQEASGVIAPTTRPREDQQTRVFVVESDITKTQDRVRVIENNSNLV